MPRITTRAYDTADEGDEDAAKESPQKEVCGVLFGQPLHVTTIATIDNDYHSS